MSPIEVTTILNKTEKVSVCDSCDFVSYGQTSGTEGVNHAAEEEGHKVTMRTTTTILNTAIAIKCERCSTVN